jgi:hypothetical protein
MNHDPLAVAGKVDVSCLPPPLSSPLSDVAECSDPTGSGH